MDGRAYMTNEQITNDAIREHKEELAKAKAEDEMMRRSLFGNGNKNQTTPQFNVGEGIGAGTFSPQQNSNPFGIDTSGWGNVSGNSIRADAQGLFGIQPQGQVSWNSLLGGGKSFNQPSADNPQAQAVEGQGINPNYMSIMSNGQMTPQQQQEFNEKMNLRQWLEWDAKMNGVTDPLIALARYNKFMPTMQKQAELEELRNAYYIMNSDPNDKRFTPEQRLNAKTLVEFDKKNPYYVDDHDMNVEKFNWAKQKFENEQKMFPLKFANEQLGLEGKKIGLQNRQNSVRIGDILRGFTGQVFPIERPGDYEDSDLSKTRKELVDAADIVNTYAMNKYGKGLRIRGGWRSKEHNDKLYRDLGKEPTNSHHLYGHALDIAPQISKNGKEVVFTDDEINDIKSFARAIGLNADGDNMHHDIGYGSHFHFTLPEGYYLKSIDMGNGKYLTPEMMRGVNGKNNDPFNAQDFSNAAYLWGGGADGKSKPNAELAKVLATKFVKDYRDALKKNGGNPQRAINTVQEIIKKDKQIVGPIEGNPMFDKLIFSIANEAALIANGQGGQAVQMPTEQSQTTKTDKPTNLGGWGAKVGNDNSQDRSKRDKSLDAIDNAELDENRIGMYNLDGYGQVPDAQDLNKQTGTRSYYESLLKYFGSGT